MKPYSKLSPSGRAVTGRLVRPVALVACHGCDAGIALATVSVPSRRLRVCPLLGVALLSLGSPC